MTAPMGDDEPERHRAALTGVRNLATKLFGLWLLLMMVLLMYRALVWAWP